MPLVDRTLYILMNSVTNHTVDEARYEDIPNFIDSHKQWCKKAASYVLYRKGKRYERWKKQFLEFAFDPVAIMIWARCYKRHVAFFMNYYFWCTQKQDDVSKCDIVLAFQGGTCFEVTRIMTTEEYTQAEQGIARVQAYFDEISLKENVQNMHCKKAKEYRSKVDRIESSEEEDAESDGLMSEEELDLEKFKDEADKPVDTGPSASKSPKGLDLQKSQKMDEDKNKMQKENSVEQKCSEDTDNNVQKSPTHASTSNETGDNKANDLIDDGNARPQDNSSDSSTPEDSDSGSSADSASTKNMQKRRRQSGPKPKVARVLFKTYHCLSTGCSVTKQTKAAVVKHMKEAHKDYCYKCSKCPQTFASWIGHYKHKKRHVGKAYICDECGRSFQFPGELDEHEHLHTGQDLFKCGYCEKSYPSKWARNLHEKSHTDDTEYNCTFVDKDGNVCGQTCVSPNHLKQHHRGMHGEGWNCHCGKRFSWPGTMYTHKKECQVKSSLSSTDS